MSKPVRWQEISSSLTDGEYSSAINLLRLAQQTHEEQGDMALAHILEAAHRICWACSRYQAEVSWLQQVTQDKKNQEQQLKRQLQTLINAAQEQASKALEEKQAKFIKVQLNIEEEPALTKEKSVWNRIVGFFEGKDSVPTPVPPPKTEPAAATVPTEPTQLATQDNMQIVPQTQVENVQALEDAALIIYYFGRFRVYVNDVAIKSWIGSISQSIFKYMVIHRERPIPVELLMDTFWPDAEPESGRRNLYQAIYQIRQAFQATEITIPIIRSANGTYGLHPDLSVWLDYEEFMRQYEYGHQMMRKGNLGAAVAAYEAADSLHEGGFLVDELYENWTFQMREHLERTHTEMLEQLSRHYYEQKRWALCINYAQRLLSIDNCNEEAHRILMLAYYLQGQRHLALKQYYRCVEILHQELETDPMPETVELYEQIRKNQLHFFSSQN